ncbi:acyl-coenzyme A thioesterase THEM4-like [Paroedura picta]|uniref:acyl-coenzyme A thioesterase THEM4-like n=1 Tax=Paroedura picta TaxID=143630 RepID=UPI004055D2BB
MHLVLGSCSRMVTRLACQAVTRCGPQALVCQRTSSNTAHLSESKESKDYSLPNSSWSPDLIAQYKKYTELSKDRTWKRVPSYRDVLDHMPERVRLEHTQKKSTERRMFLRNLDEEGKGFEYVMFLNPSENKIISVFQLGPYLEGPPGFAHGGSIATILDTTLGGCAMSLMGRVMTANLNINYKNPVPLGSVIRTEGKLDKVEGRKVLVSGQMWSVDGGTLHAEATALFIQLASQASPQPPERSK